MTITKRDFGKICGKSMTTVYKWIERNKGNIRDFITEDGIETAIFDHAPWNQYKAEAAHREQAEAQAGGDQTEREDEDDYTRQLRRELESATAERDRLAERIERLQGELAMKQAEIDFKEREIEFQIQVNAQLRQMAADFKQLADQAQQLHQAQILTTAPRRGLLQAWWDGITGVFRKNKETEQPPADTEKQPEPPEM